MKNMVFLFTGILLTFTVYVLYSFIDTPSHVTKKNISTIEPKKDINISTPQNDENNTLHIIPRKVNKKTLKVPIFDEGKKLIDDRDEVIPEDITEKKEELYDEIEDNKISIQDKKVKNIPISILYAGAKRGRMKIKAKEKDGIVKVKVMLTNLMLCYIEEKEKGINTNFITHIYGLVDGKLVYDASTSQNLSENPLVKFSFKGEKDKELTILYTELDGSVYYGKKKIK